MGSDDWLNFEPAIDLWQRDRTPECYAIQYRLAVEKSLLLVLRTIEIEHVVLTFKVRLPGNRTVRRHWLPGYMFVKFDIELDRWQQIQRAPGVIAILGDPTPVPMEIYHDLVIRCPAKLPDNVERSIVPIGSEVEILEGPLRGHIGIVSDARGDTVWAEVMAFNRPVRAELRVRQILIRR